MAKNKQSAVGRLVETDGKDSSKKQTTVGSSEFARRMVHHPDSKVASEMIKEQATHEADQQSGAEIARLKLDKVDIDARYAASEIELKKLEDKKAATPRYLKSSAVYGVGNENRIKWKDWQRKDQIQTCLIIVFLIIANAMGMGNVYANIMGSGNPAFLEHPYLAWMLATLMPIASVSIKFVTNFMEYAGTRKRYAQFIYTLTAIAIANWILLFGLINDGAGSDINWDDFGEATYNLGFAFVWAQLVAEILAAGALFLALEDIITRYAPDTYFENEEYVAIEKALKKQIALHEALRKERAQIHGRLVELEAARLAFINERIVEYISIRARHVATLNSHANT